MFYNFIKVLLFFFLLVIVVTIIMVVINFLKYNRFKNNVFAIFNKDKYSLNDALNIVMNRHEVYVKENEIEGIRVSEIKNIKDLGNNTFDCLITTRGKNNKEFNYEMQLINEEVLINNV